MRGRIEASLFKFKSPLETTNDGDHPVYSNALMYLNDPTISMQSTLISLQSYKGVPKHHTPPMKKEEFR